MQDLTHLAIDTARQLGVQYADVRVANYKQQVLATEDQRVSQISDRDDVGFGVRVLKIYVCGGCDGVRFLGSTERRARSQQCVQAIYIPGRV